MKKTFSLQLSPEEAYDEANFKRSVLRKAGLQVDTPETYARQLRRSIDARGRKVLVNVEAELFINESPGSPAEQAGLEAHLDIIKYNPYLPG
jgi:hypothetical protein